MAKKLILIDGNAIIHRAFHAIPPFKTSKGEPTNAIYGFSSMLLNLLISEKPDYIAVSFDLKGPTFRHKEYKEYKATRQKAPDELYAQIPRIKEVVRAFQIPIYELEGYEADDVLGTLAKQALQHEDINTYIATGDMDTLQLVGPRTFVLAPHKGFKETKKYDISAVLGKYGLKPSQVPDMKGLQGDNSDNIKGVAGIGPKTAQDLLQKYGDLENIYKNLDQITGSKHDKLDQGKEDAFFSRRLATIVLDAPIDLALKECATHEYDEPTIQRLFQELEFRSLIRKLESFHNHSLEKRNSEVQGTLF